MSTQAIEDLVHQKDALIADLQRHAAAVAVMAMNYGKKNKRGHIEYRMTQTQLKKINHEIRVRPLKTGLVVTLVEADAE